MINRSPMVQQFGKLHDRNISSLQKPAINRRLPIFSTFLRKC